jgi:uncharacterized protein involved in cysteine biosynthesis
MQRRYLLVLFIFLFTIVVILMYSAKSSFLAEALETRSADTQEDIIVDKLDSILRQQSAILGRLDDIEREVKSRCR